MYLSRNLDQSMLKNTAGGSAPRPPCCCSHLHNNSVKFFSSAKHVLLP